MPLASTPAHHLLLEQWWREEGEEESQREWQDGSEWVRKEEDKRKDNKFS